VLSKLKFLELLSLPDSSELPPSPIAFYNAINDRVPSVCYKLAPEHRHHRRNPKADTPLTKIENCSLLQAGIWLLLLVRFYTPLQTIHLASGTIVVGHAYPAASVEPAESEMGYQ
jgi:hypothetical protein